MHRARARRLGRFALSLALVLAAGTGAEAQQALRVGTGQPGGVYEAVGLGLRKAAATHAPELRIELHETEGSVDNLRRLAAGEVDLVVAQCDVLAKASAGHGEFRTPHADLRIVALLHAEKLHVVVRKGLEATTLADLQGKTVAVGARGSGTAATTWIALSAHGVDPHQINVKRLTTSEAVGALQRGDIDAFAAVGAEGMTAVEEALATGGRLLSVSPDRADIAAKRFSYLHVDTIRKEAYGLAGDVPAFTVSAAIACRADLNDELVLDLTNALVAGQADLAASHPALVDFDPRATGTSSPIPLHPGALRSLSEGDLLDYPVEVFCGVYLNSISEVNLNEGTFLFDGYIWFRWQGPLLGEEPFQFTLVNGALESIDDAPLRRVGGWHRESHRFTARLRTGFLLYDYPFDTQTLPLIIEHRWLGKEKLVLLPDKQAETSGTARNSLLASEVTVSDWKIQDVKQESVDKQYETDFSSPNAHEWVGVSSRYVFSVTLERSIVPYLVKSVFPLVVIVLMSFCVFFIDPKEFEVQAGIVITALLSCVAFHMSQAESLPQVGYLVRADRFFLLSYAVIFLALLEVVTENFLFHRGRVVEAHKLDRICRGLFPVLFFGPLAYLLFA
ncbi:MAG: TAXI family TRAP transporter solute-binding subunit [Planctomycetota bacterium]|jgi:TRAP transporter TAXI family solute receptor